MKKLTFEEHISEAFSFSFKNFLQIYLLIFLGFLVFVLSGITVIGILLWPALSLGILKSLIDLRRTGSYSYGKNIFIGFKDGKWWKSLLMYIIVLTLTVIGYLLLILPGIYIQIALIFSFFLLADNSTEVIKTLGRSRQLVHNQGWWKIFFVIYLIPFLLSILTFPLEFLGNVGVILLFLIYVAFYPFLICLSLVAYENAVSTFEDTSIKD